MNIVCLVANHLLLGLYAAEARHFSKALEQADKVQKKKLCSLLRKNQDTKYGKAHGFSKITSIKQFRQQVPLTTYEDYLSYVTRIGNGEQNLLTSEPVKLFEVTSGSVSASKLIPYTQSLKAEFQAGIKPWIWDLYTRYPKIRSGKSYWSITPVTTERHKTKGGIPVGFEEDTEYFGRISQYLMNLVFVSPKEVKQERDMDAFYYKTSLELLKTRDLTLISIWNPSLLFLMLDYMQAHRKRLLLALSKRRAKEIGEALKRGEYQCIWPKLCVVSCWCDGAAAGGRKRLKELFPHAVIQPKGLLATEGFMTVPWGGAEGGILSIRSHFFEFRNIRTQEFSSYTRLKQGETYEIILTTGGGFYRYCIRDTVQVTGYESKHRLPILQFAGKAENVSDLFGEKLNELFLRKVLAELEAEYALEKRYCLMAPEMDHYVLYVEFSKNCAEDKAGGAEQMAERLEQLLCGNFHYEYCRRLGQLKPLQVCHIYGNPRQDYLQHCVEKGQRLGDIKDTVLTREQGLAGVFRMKKGFTY